MKSPQRKEYLNDFKKNESGEYEYKGNVFAFAGSGDEMKRAYAMLWSLLAVACASSVASGCLSGAGITNTFYVIVPYIGEVSALFALAWYHFKLLTKGAEIRKYIYQSYHHKIPIAAMLLAFFAIVGLILSLVYSVSSGFKEGASNAVIYLVLKAVAALLAVVYRNRFNKLEWIEL